MRDVPSQTAHLRPYFSAIQLAMNEVMIVGNDIDAVISPSLVPVG